jgi:hypothetical protein
MKTFSLNCSAVLAFFVVAGCLAPSAAWAQDGLTGPIVHEEVDEIVIVQTGDNSFARVYFLRDDLVFADRLFSTDMHWSHNGQRFVLSWDDYCHGRIARIVEADRYSFVRMPELPRDESGQSRDWWAMNKNMRDLKRPE